MIIPDDFLPTEPGPGRDEMRKFFSWTFEEAWKEQEIFHAKYGKDIRARGPFFRWNGVQELKQIYQDYKDGNKKAVMEAIFICSMNSLPLPRWCENAFIKAYRHIKQYRAKHWEDVFGEAHPKGIHLETKRQEREYPIRIYDRIQQIKKESPETPIDGYLFESIGREFGIGSKTKTETLYYREKNLRKKIFQK